MKKLLKKMSAMLLTGVLVAGMSFTSFATSTPDGTATHTVKENPTANVTVGVSSPEDQAANGGDTLLAYQVVKIGYDGDHNTLKPEFTDLFKKFQGDDLGASWKNDDVDDYKALTSDELKPLLGNFAAYIKKQNPKPEADYTQEADQNGVAKFTGMAMGQYIILGDGTSAGAKIYQTVTAEVEPTVDAETKEYVLYDEYTVTMKTSKPSIDKNILEENTTKDDEITTGKQPTGDKHESHQTTSEIGKEITYRLNVTVPTYPEGAANKTFYVGDTLSKGLDLVMNAEGTAAQVTVKAYSSAADTEGTELASGAYTVSFQENQEAGKKTNTKLFVDFTYDGISEYHHVVIEYKAKLNADAKLGVTEGNPNNVELIYSNSPFDGSTWEPGGEEERPEGGNGYGKDEDMEIIYTYALVIDKYEEKQEDEKLSGATFELYREYNNGVYSNPVVDDQGNTVTLVTDANGAALYAGLHKGDYYLKETVAPSGYNLMTEPVKISVSANQTPYYTESQKTVTHYTYTATENADGQAVLNGNLVWINTSGNIVTGPEAPEEGGYQKAYVDEAGTTTTVESVIEITRPEGDNAANGYYKAGVSNNAGTHLPSTGGMGTTLFTIVGIILMLGAAIVMITRRRMSGK